jgi:hypothetical protein
MKGSRLTTQISTRLVLVATCWDEWTEASITTTRIAGTVPVKVVTVDVGTDTLVVLFLGVFIVYNDQNEKFNNKIIPRIICTINTKRKFYGLFFGTSL